MFRIANSWKDYNVSPPGTEDILSKIADWTSNSSLVNFILQGSVNQRSIERNEMAEYEMESVEPSGPDASEVYKYWAGKCMRWPKLSKMAKEILAIPATSAPSERAFSVGRDLFGLARMRLLPETVEALVCLRSWYRAKLLDANETKKKLRDC